MGFEYIYFVKGARKVSFTACYSGKPYLECTSLKAILTSPGIDSQSFCNLNSLRNFTCYAGKLKTQFTSPIIKSSTPGLLLDTTLSTLFARCLI